MFFEKEGYRLVDLLHDPNCIKSENCTFAQNAMLGTVRYSGVTSDSAGKLHIGKTEKFYLLYFYLSFTYFTVQRVIRGLSMI